MIDVKQKAKDAIAWVNWPLVGHAAMLIMLGFISWRLWPAPAPPQPGPTPDNPVILPSTLQLDVGRMTKVKGQGLHGLTWTVPLSSQNLLDYHIEGNNILLTPLAEGESNVGAYTTMPDGSASETVWIRITTGKPPPPVPPVPPIPPVPPVPPVPPAPIPLPGFRVVVVYDPATLTADQDGIVTGAKVRAYLQAKCVPGEDGKTKAFWIVQTNPDLTNAPKWLADCVQKHTNKTFMVVSDGKTGYDGDIPANADAAMAILSKIGG